MRSRSLRKDVCFCWEYDSLCVQTEAMGMRKQMGQTSLADVLTTPSSRRGSDRLERIASLIDWPAVSAILSSLNASRFGRPGIHPI